MSSYNLYDSLNYGLSAGLQGLSDKEISGSPELQLALPVEYQRDLRHILLLALIVIREIPSAIVSVLVLKLRPQPPWIFLYYNKLFHLLHQLYAHAGVSKKMNVLIYVIVLLIGTSVGYFLGFPGVIGMIAGAITATLIFYDMNKRKRSRTSDEIK